MIIGKFIWEDCVTLSVRAGQFSQC